MSRTAAVVCEGPADFWILQKVILNLWPEVDEILCLQPPIDRLGVPADRTGGWSMVKQWCEQNASKLNQLLSDGYGSKIGLLVIAMDVDIAVAARVENPPSAVSPYVATRLCSTVKGWLTQATRRIPSEIVIGLPAMAIESWVITAIFPKVTDAEDIPDPARFLAEKGKLKISEEGKVLKPRIAFESFGERVVARLTRVRNRCVEAERLCHKIEGRRAACEAKVVARRQ